MFIYNEAGDRLINLDHVLSFNVTNAIKYEDILDTSMASRVQLPDVILVANMDAPDPDTPYTLGTFPGRIAAWEWLEKRLTEPKPFVSIKALDT